MIARRNGKIITVTPAAASFATPYSSGDVIGGLNTLSAAALETGGLAELMSLCVIDKANQKSGIDLVFLSGVPASSFGADNAAYALADSDSPLLLGRISVATADYISSGTNNAEATEKALGLILQAAAKDKNIYMIVVARGTPTYGSATDLLIRLGLEQF